jgi:hypothetical protein
MGLNKAKRRPKRASAQEEERCWPYEAGEGGSEESARFIAETVGNLARLARRHELGLLTYLLAMTQLEAEEQVKLLRRRKLS